MNILQTTLFPVYPPNSGGDHRSHGILTAFLDSGDVVNRFTQGVDTKNYRGTELLNVNEIQTNYFEYQYKNPFHSLFRLNLLVGFPYLYPGHLLHVWKPRSLKKLVNKADVILTDVSSHIYALTKYTDDIPIIYSSHNVESERFEADNYPFGHIFQSIKQREEKTAVNNADMIICTSERDKRIFESKYDISCPIQISSNGVYKKNIRKPDNEAGQKIRSQHKIDKGDFVGLFIGSQYGPNNDAAEQLVKLAKSEDDLHVLIAGSVSETVSNPPENMTLAGFVDNIEPYYDAADIALNPMRYGGGTNIKVLDYWARSLPVLSTPFGLRGFELPNDETAVVADFPCFPQKIWELRADASLRNTLANNGRKLVQSRYTWKSISEKLRQEIIYRYV